MDGSADTADVTSKMTTTSIDEGFLSQRTDEGRSTSSSSSSSSGGGGGGGEGGGSGSDDGDRFSSDNGSSAHRMHEHIEVTLPL